MQFIQLRNISFTYPNQSEPVFEKISFDVSSEERIALIGRNGEGKSTLLKIIIGELTNHQGSIIYPKEKPVLAYLPQDMSLLSKLSVREELLSSSKVEYKIINELALYSERKSISAEEGLRIAELWEEYYRLKINEYEQRIDVLLAELELERYRNTNCQQLSEGEKTRLQMGKLLVKKPEILILDEPTNHLDIDNLQWLEKWMKDFTGAVFYVSHDREFIDRTATKIISLARGSIEIRQGNYSTYTENKDEEERHQLMQHQQRQKLIHKLQTAAQKRRAWARTFQADTGSEGRGAIYESINNPVRTMHQQAKNIEERIKMLEQRYPVEKPWRDKDRQIRFSLTDTSSGLIITCNQLCKNYGTKIVFNNLSFFVEKGEKVWLSGPNGSGKSSLIRILVGADKDYSGEVLLGQRVKVGWFDQDLSNLPLSQSPLAYTLTTNIDEMQVRNFFGCLGLTGDMVNRPISSLSWGERSKTQLVKILTSDYNLLLLDEPTNHLDINTRKMLEEALSRYPGTIVFVSHDRTFIKQIATREFRLDCSS